MATITTLLAAKAEQVKPFIEQYVAKQPAAEVAALRENAMRILKDAAYARAETIKARRQWGVRPTTVDQDVATLRKLAYTIFEQCSAQAQ